MSGPGLVAGEVAVDALPYFDQGYEAPGVREAAAALVEEETRRYRPTKNYLSYLSAPDYSAFETEIMRNEFERLAARQPLELLSMKRYELPAPSSGQKNDITAWQECVNNSMAQLEHQAVRIENLELMSQHGCNAWKVYNDGPDGRYPVLLRAGSRAPPGRSGLAQIKLCSKKGAWEFGSRRGVLVLMATIPQLPNFLTCGKLCRPDALWAGRHLVHMIEQAQKELQKLRFSMCASLYWAVCFIAWCSASDLLGILSHEQYEGGGLHSKYSSCFYFQGSRQGKCSCVVKEPVMFSHRKNIQDLNWQRKNMQLTAGSKLREMESTWVSLVSKNYEIERTIVQLENEISQIKQQHGEANKENIQQDF